MADEIARLALAVDSTPAKSAVTDLDALAGAGDRVQASMDKVAKSSDTAAKSHTQVAKAAEGYTKSAKELAFATRNLPAQFTDIAVSLQAGQNPLTVLLQQGGQLKDMFGGVGPAVKAFGNYIAGLINPYTLAAAAAVTLFAAWNSGQQEQIEFNKTMVLTGNYAARSAEELSNLSIQMQGLDVTRHKASDALNQVASAGAFTERSLKLVTQAALDLETSGGQAIEKTVAQFSKLQGDPVKAVVELNDKYHFLTAAVYEQIKSLEEQGDTLGASQLAMTTYASEVHKRSTEVKEDVGLLEAAWRALGRGAKYAWDAMLDVGREETGQQKFDELRKKLEEIENPSNSLSYAQLGAKGSEARKKAAAALREQLKKLQDDNVAAIKQNGQDQLRRETDEAAIRLSEEAGLYRTNAEKLVSEKKRIQKQADQAYADAMKLGNKELAKQIRENEADVLAGLEKKYKTAPSEAEKAAAKFLREQAAEYAGLNKQLDERKAILEKAGKAEEKLTDTQKFAERVLADMREGHSKLSPTQQQTIKDDLNELLSLDKVNQAREKKNKLLEINEDINRRMADTSAQQALNAARELRSIGHGSTVNDLFSRMDAVSARAQKERVNLAEKYGDLNAQNSQEYIDQLARIDAAEKQQLANERKYLRARQDAQGDWRNGFQRAMEDISDEVNDVAGQTHDGFINAFHEMDDAIDEFSKSGTLKIKNFAKTVIAELLKIELRILLSNVLSSMFGSAAGGVNSGADLGGSTYGQSNTYAGGLTAARGAVVAGGAQLATYALGGAFGGVLRTPSLFPMANGGTGLAGEQKPEGILPLEEMADGRLGVLSKGGGGSTINVNTTVHVHQDGTTTTTVDSDNDAKEARRLGALLENKVRDILVQEQKQGGILWTMVNRGGR